MHAQKRYKYVALFQIGTSAPQRAYLRTQIWPHRDRHGRLQYGAFSAVTQFAIHLHECAYFASQIKTLLNRICLDKRVPLMRQKRHHDCTVVIKTPLNGTAVLQIKTLSLCRDLTSIKLKLISTAHSVTVWLGSSPDDRATNDRL